MSSDEFVVTPWNVEGDIDYEKLIKQFGTQKISNCSVLYFSVLCFHFVSIGKCFNDGNASKKTGNSWRKGTGNFQFRT